MEEHIEEIILFNIESDDAEGLSEAIKDFSLDLETELTVYDAAIRYCFATNAFNKVFNKVLKEAKDRPILELDGTVKAVLRTCNAADEPFLRLIENANSNIHSYSSEDIDSSIANFTSTSTVFKALIVRSDLKWNHGNNHFLTVAELYNNTDVIALLVEQPEVRETREFLMKNLILHEVA